MGKHAYLILAHDRFGQLEQLLSCLDHERNDIFLHVDKKSSYDSESLCRAVSHSGLYFTDRIKVSWGAFSIVEATFLLLEMAVKQGEYDYYHLLSGRDLPLRPQEEIHAFFDNHCGREFVSLSAEDVMFLDQDDLLADNALATLFQRSHQADIVVSNGINENRDKVKPIYHSVAHQKQVAFPRFYYSVGCMIVSPGQCLIRKDKMPPAWTEKCIDYNGADDYLLWLLMHNVCRWEITPEVLYTHVDTGENLSIDIDRMIRSSCEALDLLKQEGKLSARQEKIAKRRFRMRKFYEGRQGWRKVVACLLYPDLFLELLIYAYYQRNPILDAFF